MTDALRNQHLMMESAAVVATESRITNENVAYQLISNVKHHETGESFVSQLSMTPTQFGQLIGLLHMVAIKEGIEWPT